MQKIDYSSCIHYTILFSCTKRSEIKLNTNLLMKTSNKRVLQNNAVDHSADIDYKDFIKIYRKCTNNPY